MNAIAEAIIDAKESYVEMINDRHVSPIKKIAVPVLFVLSVVAVLSAIIAYGWVWIAWTMPVFVLHAVAGVIIAGCFIADAFNVG